MELPESVTNMPPQRLLLIAGAGIAAGLLWRHYSNKSGSLGGATGNPYDSMQGAGNLGALAPNIGGEPTDTSADRRDVFGSGINLPVTEWVIVGADGKRYLTNGETITPLEGASSTPSAPSTPTPTPTAPRPSIWDSPIGQAIRASDTRHKGTPGGTAYTSLIGSRTASGALIVGEIPPATPGGSRQVYTDRGIMIV